MLGQLILGWSWELLGLASLFTPLAIWITLSIALVAGLTALPHFSELAFVSFRHYLSTVSTLSLPWKLLLALTSLWVLLLGVKSVFAPLWPDSEAFYMVLPKIMAASGRLTPVRNYYDFSQIGFSGEMHSAALMAIADGSAALLYVWITSLALCVFLLCLANEAGASVKGKTVNLVLLFTTTAFTLWIYGGKVELFGASLGLAGLYWALKADSETLVPWGMAGLFTGAAVVSKLSYVPTLIPGVLVLLVWNTFFRGHPAPRLNRILAQWSAAAFFVVLSTIPQIVKNQVLFGEPFAPFLFLHQQGMSGLLDQAWFSAESTRFIVETYPLALVFGQYPYMGGNLSPLIPAFMPLLLLSTKPASHKRRLYQLATAATLGVAIWIILCPSVLCPRYILPSLLLFIPLASAGVERVFARANSLHVLKSGTLLSMLFLVSTLTVHHYLQHDRQLWGHGIPVKGKPRELTLEYFPAQEYLNSHALPGSRVFLDGYLSYYLRPDLLQRIQGRDDWDEGEFKEASSEDNWRRLYEKRFEYVLVQKPFKIYFPKALDTRSIPVWMNVTRIYEDKSSSVFQISSRKAQSQKTLCEGR